MHRRRGPGLRPPRSPAIAPCASSGSSFWPKAWLVAEHAPFKGEYRFGARSVQVNRQIQWIPRRTRRFRRRVERNRRWQHTAGIRPLSRPPLRRNWLYRLQWLLPDAREQSPPHLGPVVLVLAMRDEEPLLAEHPPDVAAAHEEHHEGISHRDALQDVAELEEEVGGIHGVPDDGIRTASLQSPVGRRKAERAAEGDE